MGAGPELFAGGGPGGGGVVIGIPAEVEGGDRGLDVVALAIEQRANDRSGIKLEAVAVAQLAAVAHVFLFDPPARGAPIAGVLPLPDAQVADQMPEQAAANFILDALGVKQRGLSGAGGAMRHDHQEDEGNKEPDVVYDVVHAEKPCSSRPA